MMTYNEYNGGASQGILMEEMVAATVPIIDYGSRSSLWFAVHALLPRLQLGNDSRSKYLNDYNIKYDMREEIKYTCAHIVPSFCKGERYVHGTGYGKVAGCRFQPLVGTVLALVTCMTGSPPSWTWRRC